MNSEKDWHISITEALAVIAAKKMKVVRSTSSKAQKERLYQ